MKDSQYISIDDYVLEQIQLSLDALRGPNGHLEDRDLQTLVPQIDYAYRRPAEIVLHFAKQVNLDVVVPAQRANPIGNEYAFFSPQGTLINTEFSFFNAGCWLIAYREAKAIKSSIGKGTTLKTDGQTTRL